MIKQELFHHVVGDLRVSIGVAHEYATLRAAGLLRLLLLYDMPLVTQVNREFRIPILFRIGMHRDSPGAMVGRGTSGAWSVVDAFEPDAAYPGVVPEEVKLDKFLKLVVMVTHGHDQNVHDLIRHIAYVNGVIHAGSPTDDRDKALASTRSFMREGAKPGGGRTLAAIGRVVLRAIEPLHAAVLSKYARPHGEHRRRSVPPST